MFNVLWKEEKKFDSYEEAKKYKFMLQTSESGATMQYKIKKYNNQKEIFVVKSRIDPILADSVEEINEHFNNVKGKSLKIKN